MAKMREKGCVRCANTGWVMEVNRPGYYCRCARGARLARRHLVTLITCICTAGALVGWALGNWG